MGGGRLPVWWILGLVPALLLAPALLGQGVLAPLDGLNAFEPWKSAAPAGAEPRNPLLLDAALVVLPFWELAAEALGRGELPLWNPYNHLGQPVHGALTGAFLWPLTWIYFAAPTWASLVFVAWAKLALAALGMGLFLRRLGLAQGAVLVGGLAYGLCAFQVVWLAHPHTNASALLPWVLLGIEHLARAPAGRIRRPVAGLAILGGLLGVAGHVPTAWHVALVGLAYALWRILLAPPLEPGAPRLRRPRMVGLGCTLLVGGALSAAQTLPFAEYTAASRGRHVAAEVGAMVAENMPAVGASAPMLVLPRWHGDPRRGDYRGPEAPHINFQELVGGYAGLGTALLAALAVALRWRERAIAFPLLLALVAAGIAYGIEPLASAARWVPGLGATKTLRLLLLVAFAVAWLAALGVDRLLARVPGAGRRNGLAVALALLVGLELLGFARGYQPAVPTEQILPPTKTGAFLQAATQDGSRVLAVRQGDLLPNANVFLRVPVLTVYDSIEDERVAQLLGLLTTDERRRWFSDQIRWFDRNMALAGMLGVRWVLSPGPLPEPLGLAHEGELRSYENPFARPLLSVARGALVLAEPEERIAYLGREDLEPDVVPVEHVPAGFEAYRDEPGSAPRGEVTGFEQRPGRIAADLRLARDALVVLAVVHSPGWAATVNGEPAATETVAHALQGLWLPAGEHRLEWRYQPRSFALGVALSSLGFILVLFLLLPRRPRPSPMAPPRP